MTNPIWTGLLATVAILSNKLSPGYKGCHHAAQQNLRKQDVPVTKSQASISPVLWYSTSILQYQESSLQYFSREFFSDTEWAH